MALLHESNVHLMKGCGAMGASGSRSLPWPLPPPGVRPQPEPRKPILGRRALESLRESILEVLAEEEASWDRRH